MINPDCKRHLILKSIFVFFILFGILFTFKNVEAQTNTASVNIGDCYIRQDVPSGSYSNTGSSEGFSIQWYQPWMATNHGLVQFTLPSGSYTITKISLFLYAGGTSGTFTDCNIYKSNSTFDEGSVNWSSAPSYDGTVISSVSSLPSGTTEGWREFVLRGDGATNSLNSLTWGSTAMLHIRFAAESGATKSFWFYSKENANTSLRPYIQITYVAPPPTVTTQAVSSIASTTATGNGTVTDNGGATITERGVVWNTSTGPTTANNKAITSGNTGAYNASITGLTLGTLYYVKAYAINSNGIGYGNEVTFTTLNIPSVSNPTATSITTNTAILGANITSDGGSVITARGTCWGTSANPISNCVAEGGTTTGVFTHSRAGLPSGTLIHYRGYATNSVGTAYSSDATFTTITPAIVDWNNSNVQEITLSANRSFTFTNGKSGGVYSLFIKQNSTGGWNITWPADIKWAGGITPTFTTTAGAVDLVKFTHDGTNYYESGLMLDLK
ncbi:MAG: hypothetical protein HGB12_16200 [Bacteroidetes bacterium]|nr:hypothetical protein [Bacteroidota bacterium]